MPPTDAVTVQDIHYAVISPLADAIGMLMWPVPITWFHDFGITHVGARNYLLRIGLPELRAGNQTAYTALRVTIFASGGTEITTQDFPFNFYDSGRSSASKEITLTDVKGKYSFIVGAGASGAKPRTASDTDLRRLDSLCTATMRWATLMCGERLPKTERHQRVTRTIEGEADSGSGQPHAAVRRQTGTDPDHVVVLDDDAGHEFQAQTSV